MQGSEAEYYPRPRVWRFRLPTVRLDLAADAASPNFATKLPHPEVRVKRKPIIQPLYQPL